VLPKERRMPAVPSRFTVVSKPAAAQPDVARAPVGQPGAPVRGIDVMRWLSDRRRGGCAGTAMWSASQGVKQASRVDRRVYVLRQAESRRGRRLNEHEDGGAVRGRHPMIFVVDDRH